MDHVQIATRANLMLDSIRMVKESLNIASSMPKNQENAGPQSFEWVNYGDASGRRRARVHVTQQSRRRKKDEALAKARELLQNSKSGPEEGVEVSRIEGLKLRRGKSSIQPYSTTRIQDQALVLLGILGSGRTDPFATLPLKLNAHAHALLDHFVFGVAPASFSVDSSADFRPVKALSFKVAQTDAAAIHILLSAGASDIASLYGRQDSEDAIKHRGLAIALVNRRLSTGISSDGALATVALLAANELLFGTPHGYNIHMNGLQELVRIRGDMETFRHCNPNLHAWICWIDYAGSCNLVSKRRFVLTGLAVKSTASDPAGVPLSLLRSLPTGYDLLKQIQDTLQRIQALATIANLDQPESCRVPRVSAFIGRFDEEMRKSICQPDGSGNRSRRQYLLQSMHLLVLIVAAVCSSGGKSESLPVPDCASGEKWEAFRAISDFLTQILVGDRVLDNFMLKMIDVCIKLDWEAARELKRQHLRYFLTEEACTCQLQSIWKDRFQS